MTGAPARARTKSRHIHLPSVHVRPKRGMGFDYDEDIYIRGDRAERIVRLVILDDECRETLIRETFDVLCPEELSQLVDDLPVLMDHGNPAAKPLMEECARKEFARQLRIARGEEHVCASCGCSETRACSGGCCWATDTLCSRCVGDEP